MIISRNCFPLKLSECLFASWPSFLISSPLRIFISANQNIIQINCKIILGKNNYSNL